MAHVRSANNNRRGNDDLEASPGYSPSGESQFSRMATRGGYRPPPDERQISDLSNLDVLILKQQKQVARLERRLDDAGDDVAEVQRVTDRLSKTKRMLDRLRREQKAAIK